MLFRSLVAWLMRGGQSASPDRPDNGSSSPPATGRVSTGTSCPRCGCSLSLHTGECLVCEWPQPIAVGTRHAAVRVELEARLARLEILGMIDTDTRRQLSAAIASHLAEAPVVDLPAVEVPVTDTPAAVVPPDVVASSETADVADTADIVAAEVVEAEIVESDPVGGDRPVEEVTERARRYAAARQRARGEQAKADRAEVDAPEPVAPRRETSEVLAAFMQERNIRWGELVGGLLIVCCSIALVISFWAEIASRPLLKFVIFNGVSAALFGAGFYTLRRWQIHTTSRGLLIIATLLVPLNFLAIAALTQQAPPTDVLSISGELLSLGMFSALVYAAAQTLTPTSPVLLTVSVMLTSLMQLVTRRFSGDDFESLTMLYLLAAVPLGCYVVTTGLAIGRMWRRDSRTASDDEPLDARLFILLGVASYAVLLPLGLLVYQSGGIVDTLSRLSPLVTVLGLPALATGLLHWRRGSRPETVGGQTVGIGVGVAGAMVMAVAIGLAWPDPALLLATTLTTAVLFALLAVALDVSAAHVVTAACVIVAWLIGFHVFSGHIAWQTDDGEQVVRTLISASSGNALVPLAALFTAVAFGFSHVGRLVDALWYLVATAATVVVSLALAVGFGFARDGDPHGVTWTLGIYAIAAIVAAVVSRREEIAWGASTLMLVALVQGIVFRFAEAIEPAQPWIVAMLGHATLVTIVGVVVRRRDCEANWTDALFPSALATSLVAAGMITVGAVGVTSFDFTRYAMATYLAWTATVWLVLSLAANWASVFAAFQIAMYLAVASGVDGVLERRDWYLATRFGWLDPWALEAQGIALAAYCTLWTMVRLLTERTVAASANVGTMVSRFGERLRGNAFLVDRCLEVTAVVLLLGVVVYGAAPGVIAELAPTAPADRVAAALDRIETNTAVYQHATDVGAWLLWGAVVAMVVAGLWHDRITARVVGLTITAGLAAVLVATWWEAETATTSALRWALAGCALIVSVPIWARQRVQAIAARVGIGVGGGGERDSSVVSVDRAARTTVIAVVLLTYAAMGVYVGGAALAEAGVPEAMRTVLYSLAGVCAATLTGALVLMGIESAARGAEPTAPGWTKLVSQTLLMTGLAPLGAAGIFVIADALRQYPIVGPSSESWFAEVGLAVSYGVPIVAMAIALLGYGVRERSSRYTLAAALMLNLTVTIVYLVQRAAAGLPLDGEAWIELGQLGAIATALFSMGWLGVWTRHRSHTAAKSDALTAAVPPPLLGSYIAFAASLCGAVVIWATAYLSVYPATPGNVAVAGRGWGWLALTLTAVCVIWLARQHNVRSTLVALTAVLGVAASMLACTVAHWDRGNWLAFHTLLAGCAVAAMVAPTLARVVSGRHDWQLTPAGVRLATLFATITVLLSLRSLDGDPQAPWWTIGGLTVMATLFAVLAWETARRRFVWAGAVLLNVAASVWWIESGSKLVASADGAIDRKSVV